MHCPKCAKENPAQARFCLQCGARLRLTCPQCQTELPSDAQFCSACGAPVAASQSPETAAAELLRRHAPTQYAERLLATRGQPHDERRTVTILFSDIKGSTAMIGKLDPEDAKEVVQGAFEFLIAPIFRYEGTLVQLMGDAILAFFGAPIAHEDDPERACRAALEITTEARRYGEKLKREKGIEGFNVRVGINTGLVVVGEVGSDLRVAYTAIGDAINLAARIEQNAEPGTVLITEATHKLVVPLFETQAMPPLQVKGKAEPVSTYRVLAAKAEVGKVRGIAGLESPLVGREAEFAALREAVERLQAGVGGIVTIVGEAGLGKSRLVAEVRKLPMVIANAPSSCHPSGGGPYSAEAISRSRGGDCFAKQTADPVSGRQERGNDRSVQWVAGRCLSYGTAVPYLLWLDVLRGLLGVTVEDSPEAVRQVLHERARTLCGDEFDHVYPYLARLLSLPLEKEVAAKLDDLDGQQLKASTWQAVEKLIQCMAAERPLVMVCEDLHWADTASLELLQQLLALSDRAALLFILVFRPEPEHGSGRLREVAAERYAQRHIDLRLRPLSKGQSGMLVTNLLRVEQLDLTLKARILSTAEGNPFYVEEIIRSLIDQGAIVHDEETGQWRATAGAVDVAIPDTLQGLLVARIDRLQEDTKRVLQMASVIGRFFLYRVLEAIAQEERRLDEHLLTLQREEMIREGVRLPELEYLFKHELTREAAYNGLLKKQRRTFHRQVAEALERLFPQRIEEQLGLLAYHWERAGDAQKATDYLLRAGDQARLLYARAEAVGFYQRALALLQAAEDLDGAARVWMKLGQTYHDALEFEQARQSYEQGFRLRQQLGGRTATSGSALPPARDAYRLAYVGPQIDSFDPAATVALAPTNVLRQLFRGLVELTHELDVVPDMAQSWEILEGGRKYIFHLRDDVLWSDGTSVTAEDFEYAWTRVLNPQENWPTASWLYELKNGRAFHEGRVTDSALVGVRAADEWTLMVELEGPIGYFLNLLTGAYAYPVPRHLVQTYGRDWARAEHIATNGPFLLQNLQPGKGIVMERNPRYGGRFPGNVQRIELILLSSLASFLASAVEMYESDQLSMLEVWAAYEEIQSLRMRHLGQYVSTPALGNDFLVFAVHRPPFDDVRVRRAFVMAVDRHQLPPVRWGLVAAGTGGFVPPGMSAHSPRIGLSFDPQAARGLLSEAGYRGGQGFPVLRALGSPSWPVWANLVEQWHQNLGIEVQVEERDVKSGLPEDRLIPEAHLRILGWAADYPDPDNFLRLAIPPVSDWRNEAFERLVEDARRCMDQAQRMRLYQRADEILVQEAAVVPLFYARNCFLVKPWVKVPFSPSSYLSAKDVVIEPH